MLALVERSTLMCVGFMMMCPRGHMCVVEGGVQ
jgi:hypothetical protein